MRQESVTLSLLKLSVTGYRRPILITPPGLTSSWSQRDFLGLGYWLSWSKPDKTGALNRIEPVLDCKHWNAQAAIRNYTGVYNPHMSALLSPSSLTAVKPSCGSVCEWWCRKTSTVSRQRDVWKRTVFQLFQVVFFSSLFFSLSLLSRSPIFRRLIQVITVWWALFCFDSAVLPLSCL